VPTALQNFFQNFGSGVEQVSAQTASVLPEMALLVWGIVNSVQLDNTVPKNYRRFPDIVGDV